jgi:SAM-dependent methyltransferase
VFEVSSPPSPARGRSRHGAALRAATALLLMCTGAAAAELVAPYVPTVREDVERMLDLAGVTAADYVIDLGSGDGRIVIAAAQRGAHAHGVELADFLVEESRQNAQEAGVDARVSFLHGNIFETDIAAATVVTLYLMPEANLRLRPKLLAELRPGARVVSNSFDMGDWQPDSHTEARTSGGILLWIIPASIAGSWVLTIDDPLLSDRRFDLDVVQRYQQVEPALADGERSLTVLAPRLRGERLSFLARSNERHYAFHGTVSSDSIDGYVQLDDANGPRLARWSAAPR